jgi:4,5-dihydroxyphthalate decarboxylase
VERAARDVHGRKPSGGATEVTDLTMALVAGEITDPIIAGAAGVKGDVTFAITAGSSVDANSRQMLNGAYDVAEMSFATFLKAREQGRDLIGLPIFTGRGYLQPGLLVSTASGITRPEDIASRRVGVPQFWMTSSVWHRGILQQQHGVPAEAIEWFTAAEERFEGVTFPAGVKINRLAEGMNPNAALEQGLVDAVMVPPRGARGPMRPGTQSPYADLPDAQRTYFVKTGVFPIMHFVVMRESVHRKLPWLAGALGETFLEAKRGAEKAGTIPPPVADETWEFGLTENARALDTFLGFAREQGWISEGLTLADCFVAS